MYLSISFHSSESGMPNSHCSAEPSPENKNREPIFLAEVLSLEDRV